jgi:hypothetical protein
LRNAKVAKLAQALGLPSNAYPVDIRRALEALFEGLADDPQQEEDVRETMRSMAEQIANEKHLPFREALELVRLREPLLVQRLTEFYADLRERGR